MVVSLIIEKLACSEEYEMLDPFSFSGTSFSTSFASLGLPLRLGCIYERASKKWNLTILKEPIWLLEFSILNYSGEAWLEGHRGFYYEEKDILCVCSTV